LAAAKLGRLVLIYSIAAVHSAVREQQFSSVYFVCCEQAFILHWLKSAANVSKFYPNFQKSAVASENSSEN